MKHPFRRKNLDPRLLACYAAAIVAFVFARPTAAGLVGGGALAAAGLALRAWGAGHLVKTERLTVSGPYAHLRHPLYAGTLLIGVGFALMVGGVPGLLLAAAFLPLFFFRYMPTKEGVESERLARRYGEPYVRYRAEVRALWPSLSAWRPPPELRDAVRSWSVSRFRDNSEPGTVVGVCAGALALALRPLLPFP